VAVLVAAVAAAPVARVGADPAAALAREPREESVALAGPVARLVPLLPVAPL
jgi:hypothetical protein